MSTNEIRNYMDLLAACKQENAALAARCDALENTCPVCGHVWSRHDPEDGKCDAGMPGAIGVPEWGKKQLVPCPCGRDLAYHRFRARDLSRAALAATETTREVWAGAPAEELEIALREWLDDDDAVSVVQEIVARGWVPPAGERQET